MDAVSDFFSVQYYSFRGVAAGFYKAFMLGLFGSLVLSCFRLVPAMTKGI